MDEADGTDGTDEPRAAGDAGANLPPEPRPSALAVWDALNEPRPDLAGPVLDDGESPLALAAARDLFLATEAEADGPGPRALEDEPADTEDVPQDDPAEVLASDAPRQPGAWAVLREALAPRMSRAQVLAGLLCAVLGFALVVQVRQASGADLNGMRQADLVRILDEVTTRNDALAAESADLARERDGLLSGSDRRQAALDALRRSAETQGILTGRLPAQGPGVVVVLTEPDGSIKPVTMLNMLEELRNAGAEAIELNGQRVTASSSFTGTGGNVVLDGVAIAAPYEWTAIGDPDTMSTALQIPGGAMAQVRNNGGRGTVDRRDTVEITALRILPDPVYATPVPASGG